MKFCLWFLMFATVSGAFAQQEYFTPENKKEGIAYYKKRIYSGCSDLKEKQEPVSVEEMRKLVANSVKIVEENFSKSFDENPKVRESFKKDMLTIMRDQNCQLEGNDCRARLMGLSLYYYQQFRANIPDCEKYVKSEPISKSYNTQCELELKYRKSSFQGVHSSTYGMPGIASYKKELIAYKNNTTIQLFSMVMHKDKINLHICNPVQSGIVHQYALDNDDAGDFYVGLDPEFDIRKSIPKECKEEKLVLYSEFLPTSFDEGRSTVGNDVVEPIKQKITSFIQANPEMIVTDVSVTSSSSKTPFHTMVAGKKVIDPKSNEKNLALAQERANFAEKVMNEIKNSGTQLKNINFVSKAELAGPEFEPMDLNDRFVTRMTPGYIERIEAVYQKNKKLYEEQALKTSSNDLLDEKQFVNLYQAKFKPFQGFRIVINGYKKEEMKCLELVDDSTKPGSKSTATKQ
jgi:glycerol-3-phosphate cytidylyltransferase-like family protein/cytidylate kinase